MSGRRAATLAVYWAGSCGGCDVALLNVGERLLTLDREFEIAFWPCVADFRHEDLASRADGSVDLCLLNGAIRTQHDLEMARLLRRKSRLLVAFGSCAQEGCVPALANLASVDELLAAVFLDRTTTVNPQGVVPGTIPEGSRLPALLDAVRSLDQVVAVDYVVPGCPPESGRVVEVLDLLSAVLAGERAFPEPGAVLGAGPTTVCEECPLERRELKVKRFLRPYEVVPDAVTCLLGQGLVCSGPATRGGCGALCPRVGIGCRGCYGPGEGVEDIGARLTAALAAVVDSGTATQLPDQLAAEVEAAMASVVDPAGTLYRYAMAHALRQAGRPGPGGPAGTVGHDAHRL